MQGFRANPDGPLPNAVMAAGLGSIPGLGPAAGMMDSGGFAGLLDQVGGTLNDMLGNSGWKLHRRSSFMISKQINIATD